MAEGEPGKIMAGKTMGGKAGRWGGGDACDQWHMALDRRAGASGRVGVNSPRRQCRRPAWVGERILRILRKASVGLARLAVFLPGHPLALDPINIGYLGSGFIPGPLPACWQASHHADFGGNDSVVIPQFDHSGALYHGIFSEKFPIGRPDFRDSMLESFLEGDLGSESPVWVPISPRPVGSAVLDG